MANAIRSTVALTSLGFGGVITLGQFPKAAAAITAVAASFC